MTELKVSEWDVVSSKKTISYSVGFFIPYYLGVFFSTFVFYYYEVVIGLPILLIALAFIIYAIWNMLNDPLIGYLTDKPMRWTKRWGMRTPWIIIGLFPSIICYFFIFTPPEVDAKVNPMPIFIYLVIVVCIYDTFVSLYLTHLNAGFPNQFRTDFERRKASVPQNIIPNTGTFLLSLIPPFLLIYGDRNSMITIVAIVLTIIFFCAFFLIPGIRESEEIKDRYLKGYDDQERESFWKLMKIAFHHKNYVIALMTYALYLAAYGLWLTSSIYFIKDVLRLPFRVTVYLQLAIFLGFTGFVPFWANVAKRLGHVKTYTLGCLLVSLTLLPTLWITTLWEAILYNFIGAFGFGCFYIMLYPIASDTYDEITADIGKHQEATLSGIRTFFFRTSLITIGLVISAVHILTGYNPDPDATQTPLAIWGIRIHMGLIPSLMMLFAFILMYKYYDLKDEKKQAMITKLRELGL
ncbi:MAG: MFS transporter [Promethearchaeota archaeon]